MPVSQISIEHEWQNGPEILTISGFDGRDCVTELSWMLPILNNPENTGTARELDGTYKKSNSGIYFEEVYTPKYAAASPSSVLCEQIITESKSKAFTPNSVFRGLYNLQGFNVLFSAYRNGDYYKAHRDTAKLTLLIWVGDHNFTGGDLYLPDFDYTIPFQPDTAVLFPSHYQHEVTKVETEQEGYVRFVVSAFIN